jgi:hypothetical protein
MLAFRPRRSGPCLRKLAARHLVLPATCVVRFDCVEHKHAPPHGRQLLLPLSSCVGRRRIYVAFF